jgi:cysteine synthase A
MPQSLLDRAVIDDIVTVKENTAWRCARDVIRICGQPVGPSSGAAVAAALQLRAGGLAGPIVAVCACSIHEYIDGSPDLDTGGESP